MFKETKQKCARDQRGAAKAELLETHKMPTKQKPDEGKVSFQCDALPTYPKKRGGFTSGSPGLAHLVSPVFHLKHQAGPPRPGQGRAGLSRRIQMLH